MDKILNCVLIGAGCRGVIYTDIMHDMPEQYRVIAVAEPESSRREHVQKLHGIPDEMCFSDYHDLLALGKIADLAMICTQDSMHFEPAMMAIDLGYDLLLEKPMSPTERECALINEAARARGVKVIICTVLRYTPLFGTIKNLIVSGRLGKIMSINHEENVGNVHQSHSFVRGNWGNEGRSSGMLLQKSCHDLDLLAWLIGEKCTHIQSFGTLSHFKASEAPEGSPYRCIDGCICGDTCPYNSVKLYLDDKDNYWFRSTSTKKQDPTDADVEYVLRNSQYGCCVYKCDNDVVDHQIVNMMFESGATATFTMNAFNKGGRFIHIMGTKGELRAEFTEESKIELYDFETKTTGQIPIQGAEELNNGHGGGDEGIIEAIYPYLIEHRPSLTVPEVMESFRSHVLVFAAEASRHNMRVINVDEYIAGLHGAAGTDSRQQ